MGIVRAGDDSCNNAAGSRGFEGGRSLSSPDPNVHEAGLVTRDLFLV